MVQLWRLVLPVAHHISDECFDLPANVFTTYLAAVSLAWNKKVGKGLSVRAAKAVRVG